MENYKDQRNFSQGNYHQKEGTNSRTQHQSSKGGYGIDTKQIFNEMKFDSTWIKNETDKNLIDFAETAGKYMARNGLTNSKIRRIYSEIKRIQMEGFEKEKASFYLLRPKVAYALGREPYNKGLELFKIIFEKCAIDVVDEKTYKNFCNLLEAVLAYHKAHGGKD